MTCWPTLDADRGLVAVPDLGAVGEGLDGAVAVGAGRAGLGDHAVGDGEDRGAGRGGEVEAGVVARPEAAGHAEAGGEVVALRSGRCQWFLAIWPALGLGGPAERLQLGVALGGLLLGGRLELGVGGVLQGLALGVTADRRWRAGRAGVADGVGAARATGLRGERERRCPWLWWSPTVTAPAPAMASASDAHDRRDGREDRGRPDEHERREVRLRRGGAVAVVEGRRIGRTMPAAVVRSVVSHGRFLLVRSGWRRPATITARSVRAKFEPVILWRQRA